MTLLFALLVALVHAAVCNDVALTILTDRQIYNTKDKTTITVSATNTQTYMGAVEVAVKNANGLEVHKAKLQLQGVSEVTDAWDFSEKEQDGGVYNIEATFVADGDLCTKTADATVELREHRAPKLTAEILFPEESFAPDQKVFFTMRIERLDAVDQDFSNVEVKPSVSFRTRFTNTYTMITDGKLNKSGKFTGSFAIPVDALSGTFSVDIIDSGVVESFTKKIVVVTPKRIIQMSFHDLGGHFYSVPGRNSTVFFEARDSVTHEPVSVTGFVRRKGRSVKSVFSTSTVHEGRGMFSFPPYAGVPYEFVVTEPELENNVFTIAPFDIGPTLHMTRGKTVFQNGESMKGTIVVPKVRKNFPVKVSLWNKDVEVDSRSIMFGREDGKVTRGFSFPVKEHYAGVMRIVLQNDDSDNSLQFYGEVLVFVHPAVSSQCNSLNSECEMTAESDLLEKEVLTLKDPEAYLNDDEKLQLLLGTQTWRLFAFNTDESKKKFLQDYPEKAPYILNM